MMPRLLVVLLAFLLLVMGLLLPFRELESVVYALVPEGDIVEYCSTDGPRAIPADDAAGITSTINVPDNYLITDLNLKLNVTHSYMGDISSYISRVGETGRRIIIRRPNNGNCSGNDLNNNIADDEASQSFENSCANSTSAYTPGAAYRAGDPPISVLANYDGQRTNGAWHLNFADDGPVDSGIFNQWCLQFTVAAPTATPTGSPAPTRTPGPTPTQPTLPTFVPTATRTPIPTPATTPTPFPPGTEFLYLPQILDEVAFKGCQTVEDETTYPNNAAFEALQSLEICINELFVGKHNLVNDREDIYKFIVPGGGEGNIPITVTLDVADSNLTLLLYNNSVTLIGDSDMPGTSDEMINVSVPPGQYFVRVYRNDDVVSEQPYQLLVSTAAN